LYLLLSFSVFFIEISFLHLTVFFHHLHIGFFLTFSLLYCISLLLFNNGHCHYQLLSLSSSSSIISFIIAISFLICHVIYWLFSFDILNSFE